MTCEPAALDSTGARADAKRRRYFEGGVSSVYLWDLDDGFAGVVLLKKSAWVLLSRLRTEPTVADLLPPSSERREGSFGDLGLWCVPNPEFGVLGVTNVRLSSTVHVFEASERQRVAHYKLTSTVMLYMIQGASSSAEVALGGSMTRQVRLSANLPARYY